MDKHRTAVRKPLDRSWLVAAVLALAFAFGGAQAQGSKRAEPQKGAPAAASSKIAPTTTTEFVPQISVTIGKSNLLKLPQPAVRVSVGNPAIADVVLLNPSEVYLVGKAVGATNVIIWSKSGHATIADVEVGMDTAALQARLAQIMPGEKGIKVSAASDSLILSGTAADAVKVDKAITLAMAYGAKRVVNMLQATAPQQVMLEVQVAEISKILLDKLGVGLSIGGRSGSITYRLLSNSRMADAVGLIEAIKSPTKFLAIDADTKDGLVKILAEPTIMAVSGQEGAFLAGGKILIPVAQAALGGGTAVTLEEREFGVGLRFTPTVLEDGRINLRVTPEVSELSQTGVSITASGLGSNILPLITTRRASTTVQLRDGQSFAIGGLIKNNITETVKAFPGLGDIPILGALFRSNEFQNDRSELLFVVTPRLVKPLPPNYALPTDYFLEPTPSEFLLQGKMEGTQTEESKPAASPGPEGQAPAPADKPSGFEMK